MYKTPLKDTLFNWQHLLGFDDLTRQLGRDDFSLDLAAVVLEEAGKLASDILSPLNQTGDQKPPQRLEDDSVRTSPGFAAAWQAFSEAGWPAMEAEEAWGGQQMPFTVTAAVNELWHGANMSFGLCHLLTQGQIYALQKSASPQQKQTYIPPMAEGRWTGTMNLTEPQAGTDLGALKTRAEKQGDHYLITGQKIYITWGEHDMAENIIHLVLARTPDAPPGIKGISVFIVPKFLVNEDGSLGERNRLRCLSIEKKLGIKASPTAVLAYEGAVGWLVGEENKGLEIMFGMMNHARFAVGAQGLAISELAVQKAASYAFDRVQGTPLEGAAGQPIIHHPDVLRQIGMMRAETEAMRAVMLLGAAEMDRAHYLDRPQAEAAEERAALLVPVIKGWLTERALAVTSEAVQVHGGMGFIEETGIAQLYRDARILPIYEGTTAIQANDLIFRKTLRDGGAAVRALLAEIKEEARQLQQSGHPQPQQAAACLKAACQQAEQALDWLLASANEPRRAAANGSHWVMLLGWLCGGWQMARASGKAAALLAAGEGEADWLQAKLASADIYMHQHLPQLQMLSAQICGGDKAVLAMQPDWLALD